MEIKDAVYRVLNEVLKQKQQTDNDKPFVEDEALLADELGLGSLQLAQVVAKLEQELGVDPFSEEVAVTSIRTVSDLVDAYDKVSNK